MYTRDLTNHSEVIKAWECPDAELQAMRQILPRIPLSVRPDYQECIRLHAEYIESGLVNIPWSYQEILQALDPYLRLRWDMQCQCYVIERVDTGLRAWVRLFRWANDDGTARPISTAACNEIVAKLRACDMRLASSPTEYLDAKRDRAAKRQRYLWSRGVDELSNAIDMLPRKSVDNFIAVERALLTGERINVRGSDADLLNRWHDASRESGLDLMTQNEALNPGMRPGQYVRQHERDGANQGG